MLGVGDSSILMGTNVIQEEICAFWVVLCRLNGSCGPQPKEIIDRAVFKYQFVTPPVCPCGHAAEIY